MNKFLALIFILILFSCGGPMEKFTQFEIETPMGTMKGILYNDTPLHRDNFVKLAKAGALDGTLFHRVIQGFMIQGGDPNSRDSVNSPHLWGQGGPGYTIPAEIKPSHVHKKGAMAAARLGGGANPKKESSGSQFYIVHGNKINNQMLVDASTRIRNNFDDKFAYSEAQQTTYKEIGGVPFLDLDYTVFGEITEGLEIIDKIAAVPTEGKGSVDRPRTPVSMKIKVIE